MIVALHVSPGTFDSVRNAQAIVYQPYLAKDGRDWLSTWNATVLDQHTWQADPLILEQTVEDTLKYLTQAVRPSQWPGSPNG